MLTNDPALARAADDAGVNRIGLDLERIGKAPRQSHLKTWISDHEEHQLAEIRKVLKNGALFTRTNPIHAGLKDEIDRLIDAGAQVLMLPYFRTVDEARRFIEYVDGRALVSLLVETASAAVRVEEIAALPGVDEIHIGLNDLHLDLKLHSHFELLATDFVEMICRKVRQAGVPLGIGGLARAEDPTLPVSSELIYPQYPRLQADRALVSRVFFGPDYRALDLVEEFQKLRQRLDYWHQQSPKLLAARFRELQALARERRDR